MKPILRLYDLEGTGIILAWRSGVIYSNQTCGIRCEQPEIEGVFIPLGDKNAGRSAGFQSAEEELSRIFLGKYHGGGAFGGIDEEDAAQIDTLLGAIGIPHVTVNRQKLDQSHESWIHVLVNGDSFMIKNVGPYPRPGILTWPNSD